MVPCGTPQATYSKSVSINAHQQIVFDSYQNLIAICQSVHRNIQSILIAFKAVLVLFKTASYKTKGFWMCEPKLICDIKILSRTLWLHLSLFLLRFGFERRHGLQSITSIQPQRGHDNVDRKTTGASACHQCPKKTILYVCRLQILEFISKADGRTLYCQLCLSALFRHQFLTAGPDKAHCWLAYRTNTLL